MYLVIVKIEELVRDRGTGLDRERVFSTEYLSPVLFSNYEIAKVYAAEQGHKAKIVDLQPVDAVYVVSRRDGKRKKVCFSEQGVKDYLRTKKKELYTVELVPSNHSHTDEG